MLEDNLKGIEDHPAEGLSKSIESALDNGQGIDDIAGPPELHGVYRARLAGWAKNTHRPRTEPLVDIIAPDGQRHAALIKLSIQNNLHRRLESNKLYELLLADLYTGNPGRIINVKVIGIPQRPTEIYLVVGTKERTRRPLEKISYDTPFDPSGALDVLRSDKIFYGMVLPKKFESHNTPIIVCTPERLKKFGYLRPIRTHGRREFAINRGYLPSDFHGPVTLDDNAEQEYLWENSIRALQSAITTPTVFALHAEDRLLVRRIGANSDGSITIFEPVINISADDNAYASDGRRLITLSQSLEPGHIIRDLPILGPEKPVAGKDYARGYLMTPLNGKSRTFYPKVIVEGGLRYIGKFVPEANITAVTQDYILAKARE